MSMTSSDLTDGCPLPGFDCGPLACMCDLAGEQVHLSWRQFAFCMTEKCGWLFFSFPHYLKIEALIWSD